jgi:DNA-binding transcriptional regulator/RsmH inhibitor MraZ
MTNLETPTYIPPKYLEWIHSTVVDDKHRIRIPSEWQEYFWDNRSIKILYTGHYGIVISQKVFDEYNTNPALIIHTVNIDESFRFLISVNFQKTYWVSLEETVFLIGKWNHMEVHFSKEKFEETKNRALQAAVALQVELIQNQKNIKNPLN